MAANNPIGTKAYYDTFSGLIPCVTLGWSDNGKLRFKLTAGRGPYKRGEILESTPTWVPPRSAVRRKRYSSTIGHYEYAKQ